MDEVNETFELLTYDRQSETNLIISVSGWGAEEKNSLMKWGGLVKYTQHVPVVDYKWKNGKVEASMINPAHFGRAVTGAVDAG